MLHFPKLDANASYFNLIVFSPHPFEAAIRIQPANISCSIQPVAKSILERIGDKMLVR
ncbi:hypothetical protein D3C84_1201070 [compost metagenome]